MPDSWYRGKIVLIGSDVTLVDRHRTPFSTVLAGDAGQLPGVVIQAHGLSQLLHHKISPVANWPLDFTVALLFALMGAALGIDPRRAFVRAPVVLVGLILLLWGGGVFVFRYGDVMVELLAPSLALIASFGAVDSLGGREARKQRAFIQGAFSRYVSPKVVEQMVADPTRMSLAGERREMTFLFSDIADFTTMSEKLEAGELARMLNGYLDGMTNIVLKHGGMVDKFIGDAVFAIFNAPIDLEDHASKAVRCMLEMDDFGQAYRREQKAAGVPLGVTRVGVHTGRGGDRQFRQPGALYLYRLGRCGEHGGAAGRHQQISWHPALRQRRDAGALQRHCLSPRRLGGAEGQDRTAGAVGTTA